MRGSMMRRWTREEHITILSTNTSDTEAAAVYSEFGRGRVSRTTAQYWRKIFIEHNGKLATADRALYKEREFLQPQPDDDIGDYEFIPEVAKCILVIPDIHAPYQHKDALLFLDAVRKAFPIDLVVNLGDELDYHAMSFHDSDPNLESAGTELEMGKVLLRELHKMFPQLLLCHSNHGSMVYRRAKAHGIPVQLIKRYREIVFPEHGAREWSWAYSWRIRTPLGIVQFQHQSTNVLADAAHNACNLIVGHSHGNFGVEYSASSAHLYYGGYAGCLIDKDSIAFAYGKNSTKKPIIGCMVILNGRPMCIPMVLNKHGRWIGKL